MRFWSLILIISGFGWGCRENAIEKNTRNNLKFVIHGLIGENNRWNNYFRFAAEVYPQAKPFAELAQKLNSCFYSYIDSTLTIPTVKDTALLTKKFRELEVEYLKIFTPSQQDKRTLLLLDDAAAFGLKEISSQIPSSSSFELTYYLMIQKALLKHISSLEILAYGYGRGCWFFTKYEEMGKTLSIIQNEKTTDITFFFHYSKRDFLFELQNKIALRTFSGIKIIPLKTEIKADTAYLTSNKLTPGDYILSVAYKESYETGTWRNFDLLCPFKIK